MLIVLAVGGHALHDPARAATAGDADAFDALAAALQEIGARHQIVLVHGSGPQAGIGALEGARAGAAKSLDLICAEVQGSIGYRLSRTLGGRIAGRVIATVITQVIVDSADPGFQRPSKPIGPVLDAEEAARLAAAYGWSMGEDRGGMRRLVASPLPLEIVERDAIRRLVDSGAAVICGGGGGIPVWRRPDGGLEGVEAVIDKDHVASLLARRLGAEALIFATDVEAVRSDWPPPQGDWLTRVSPAALRRLSFAEGSMAPKVEAACAFVEGGGRYAAIGDARRLPALIGGRCGTIIVDGATAGERVSR